MSNRTNLETFLKNRNANICSTQETVQKVRSCYVTEQPALLEDEPEASDFNDLERKLESMKSFSEPPSATLNLTTRLTSSAVDESLPAALHSKQLEDGCEDLKDRLLEGALKNLEYFPQLFQEIEHQKKEEKEQERIAAEKQRIEALKAEEEKLAMEREQAELLKKKKVNAVRKAHLILDASEKEKLYEEIERVHAECSKVHETNDKLKLQLRVQEEKVKRLARLYEKVKVFVERRKNSSQLVATTPECQQLLGISRDDLHTVNDHEEFVKLSKLKCVQADQLASLKDKLASLDDEKSEFEHNQVLPVISATSINGCSVEELKRRVQELHETRRRLTGALDQYNQS